MIKRKELNSEQRGAIIYGYKSQDTLRAIATRVGCSKTTVGDVIKRFRETGCTKSQTRQIDRPHLIEGPTQIFLKQLVKEDQRLNTSQITNLFNHHNNLNVSKTTVRRALYKENLRCRIAHPKPLLSEANITARLAWCLKYKN